MMNAETNLSVNGYSQPRNIGVYANECLGPEIASTQSRPIEPEIELLCVLLIPRFYTSDETKTETAKLTNPLSKGPLRRIGLPRAVEAHSSKHHLLSG